MNLSRKKIVGMCVGVFVLPGHYDGWCNETAVF